MGYKEEYLLSEYQDLGLLNANKDVHIVRNKENGLICVKKTVPLENRDIYLFLKKNPSHYMPHIFECMEMEDSLVLIEEYITGDHLENIVRKSLFSEKEALWIIKELCYALMPLHYAQPPIICRDLKTENVMLTNKNEVKIIDFDIARIYKKGLRKDTRLMGTEGYAAPEQYGYQQTDCRTDIYALGVLLNYLILYCFPGEKRVNGPTGMIIQKCTEMDPANRYQTVEELLQAIDNTGITSEKMFNFSNLDKGLEPNEVKTNHKIPGFRTGKLWKMILAILGYLFITYICFTTEITNEGEKLTGGILWLERFFMWIGHIVFVLGVFDSFHVNKRIPLLRSSNLFLKLIGYVLSYFIIITVAVSICMTLEMFFF